MGFPSVVGRRVLIFGDSLSHHSGADRDNYVTNASTERSDSPGQLLGSWFLKLGAAAVRVNANVGRSAYNFFTSREDDHDAVLASLKAWAPSVVVIFLGSNDLGLSPKVDAKYMKQIRDTFAATADVWCIGPPSFDNSRTAGNKTFNQLAIGVVAMEKEVFGADHFIDARPLTADMLTAAQGRTKDLVHFQAAAARTFAARLADWIQQNSKSTAYGPLVGLATLVVAGGVAFVILRQPPGKGRSWPKRRS